ncbi:PQ-loop domain-containing transporter [Metamycoplasma equirhinis]|uniref:PQ-loop domain-containing transporter n=1 Tax=Metamycoplasma equirhinis TaxID=92402 RepID=UPI0035945ED3
MNIAIETLGILGALATIGLGIPQLIQQLKTKKTGKVNFASFWIFYIGIVFWVIYGMFAGPSYWQVFVANIVCTLIYSATMYYLYYFLDQKTKKQMMQVIIGITIISFVCLVLLILFSLNMNQFIKAGMPKNKHDYIIPILPEAHRGIIAAIAPSLTTLAFLPQLIINLKNKDFKGVSQWMPFLFMINNLLWIVYFILKPINHDPSVSIKDAWIEVTPALAWQFISLTVYFIQFTTITVYNAKQKKIDSQPTNESASHPNIA